MPASLLEYPRLSHALFEEPHLQRVVLVAGADKNRLIRHELDGGNVSSIVRHLNDGVNFLLIQVPEGDGGALPTDACQEADTHGAI